MHHRCVDQSGGGVGQAAARHPQRPEPKQQRKRLPRWAGRYGQAGHAVNPSMGARWRLARVRRPAHTARPGLGVLPNPPEGMPRAHGANGPACPYRPTPDSVPPSGRSTPCVDGSSYRFEINEWIGCHPRMAWIYASTKVDTHQQPREPVEGGVGPVAGVSAAWMPRPSPHGRVYGVPRNRTHPAIPQETCFCFRQLPLPLPLRVPGGSPADTPQAGWPSCAGARINVSRGSSPNTFR